MLNAIADRVPGTVVAEKALLRVADHHYNAKQIVEAVEAYDHYIKTFPKSPRKRMSYAMLRAARARYAQYRGDAFDDTPLIDAQERFDRYSKLYPEQADKANIPVVLSQIRNSLVQRYYSSGKFYKRVGRKKASIFYYKRVIAQDSQSHWARRAEDELRALGVKPAIAPKNLDAPKKSDSKTDANSKSPKNGKVEK
jgi:outer membrane protein assembly factor BamD (BamD/ComL family)